MVQESYVTDVGRVFRENEILLTGGSGSLGKVVLALLLDRYPSLKHVHVLIRPGRDFSALERFDAEIMTSPVMASLLQQRGERHLRDKINVLPGDVSQPNFGLDPQTVEKIRGKIRLIINCAGTVEFSPPVDESLRSNVDGVKNAIVLAHRL